MSEEPPTRTALRRVGAAVSLAASAVGFGILSTRESDFVSLTLAMAALAGMTGAASLLLLRRGVIAQVLGRAMAWVILLPAGAGVLADLLGGHRPELGAVGFVASSATALLLARSTLHTREARREFDPVAYRRIFLAGATATLTGALAVGMYAVAAIAWGPRGDGVGLTALAVAMLASALGVLRMRGWGVLLGGATAVGSLAAAALVHDEFAGVALALAALPGALLASPLILARLRPPDPTPEPERGFAPAAAMSHPIGPEADVYELPPAPARRARIAEDVHADSSDDTAAAALAPSGLAPPR